MDLMPLYKVKGMNWQLHCKIYLITVLYGIVKSVFFLAWKSFIKGSLMINSVKFTISRSLCVRGVTVDNSGSYRYLRTKFRYDFRSVSPTTSPRTFFLSWPPFSHRSRSYFNLKILQGNKGELRLYFEKQTTRNVWWSSRKTFTFHVVTKQRPQDGITWGCGYCPHMKVCGFHLRNFSGIDSTEIIPKKVKQSLLFSKKLFSVFHRISLAVVQNLIYRVYCLSRLSVNTPTYQTWMGRVVPAFSKIIWTIRFCKHQTLSKDVRKYAKWCGCPMARVPSVHRFYMPACRANRSRLSFVVSPKHRLNAGVCGGIMIVLVWIMPERWSVYLCGGYERWFLMWCIFIIISHNRVICFLTVLWQK